MYTIKQIAEMAGVSPTTVSNVLNGNTAKVSAKTRQRVEAMLREHNYAPNMAAHILAHNRSRIVGVIMFMEPRRNETVLEDPFSSTLLGAIEVGLRNQGFYMMLHTTSDEEEVLHLSRAWKLAGLILIWVPEKIISTLKRSIATPVVYVDSYYSEEDENHHSVRLEDRSGGYEMAKYLLSMGHRRLVFLANDSVVPGADHARFAGCREALAEAGLELEDERFVPLSKDRAERYVLYRRFAGDRDYCTALVFSADYYAAEAVAYLREIGVEVPRDLSVTGFDNNIFSRIVSPPLTTVHQDVDRKGRIAVELLMKALRGEPVETPQVRLPIHLEIRESVARLDPSPVR